ncbi:MULTISPECIES: SRPBCC family protein [Lysobacter]|uniref:SRPBCC family protein n=1 Tax=Lysobacter TaxID=68 RepID=UPI001F438E7E|nr:MULTISPECIES: SRPBCC family protein [Lysobacter]UJB17805.1 SRPBCC family protein [Lysobacter capsici]UJQ28473.1 SRPBCC family protein [Lysobacter gummosus]
MSKIPDSSPTPPPLPPAKPEPPRERSSRMEKAFMAGWPIVGGALIGLILRGIFNGNPGSDFAAMVWIFILLAPFAIGAFTVYLAEEIRPRTARYHFFMPMLSVSLCVLGSMALLWEGWICVILILPLFAVMGAVGGVIMGALYRTFRGPKAPTAYSFVALPVVLAMLGVGGEQPRRYEHVERRVLIQATPAQVWRNLLDADHIRADEVDRAWMYRIGVPTPLAGLTHQTPTGLVREVRMGKGIHFRQMSADWSPQRYVHWQYKFEEDSVPAGALDDHVRIGGDYFDLLDTRYTLTPRGDATELSIRMDYRVSTGFNWYTVPLADWLIGNFSEVILEFYRHRAEAPASAG